MDLPSSGIKRLLIALAMASVFLFPAVADEAAYPWAPGEQDASRQFDALREAGKYDEAIPVAERWLSICEVHHGPDNRLSRKSIESLAMVYMIAQRYKEAEVSLFARTKDS